MTKLKTCPFCGNEVSKIGNWEIQCSGCGVSVICGNSDEEMITLWNNREPAPKFKVGDKVRSTKQPYPAFRGSGKVIKCVRSVIVQEGDGLALPDLRIDEDDLEID